MKKTRIKLNGTEGVIKQIMEVYVITNLKILYLPSENQQLRSLESQKIALEP